jgi:phage terminase large subunit
MYYTCNPGNVGHAWIKRLFIDRIYREKENPSDYTFIQANIFDNYILMQRDPGYVTALENMPEDMRRMHLYGDWDVMEGQYFREFRRERHVMKPFPIPSHWRRFRSMDWGYNDPCCVLWHASDEEGRVYTYRELYARGMLASEAAKLCAKLSSGEDIRYTVASPDAWQKRGMLGDIGGESIAEVFARTGMPLIRADASRIAGWMRVREYMSDAPDGNPWWKCFDTCSNLVRTLPLMIHDEHFAEDIADGLEDHAPEALRYGLMSRPQRAILPEAMADEPTDFEGQATEFLGYGS